MTILPKVTIYPIFTIPCKETNIFFKTYIHYLHFHIILGMVRLESVSLTIKTYFIKCEIKHSILDFDLKWDWISSKWETKNSLNSLLWIYILTIYSYIIIIIMIYIIILQSPLDSVVSLLHSYCKVLCTIHPKFILFWSFQFRNSPWLHSICSLEWTLLLLSESL